MHRVFFIVNTSNGIVTFCRLVVAAIMIIVSYINYVQIDTNGLGLNKRVPGREKKLIRGVAVSGVERINVFLRCIL